MEIDKRGKERKLKSNSNLDNRKDIELKEKQVERELKDIEEELERLKQMIRDKKVSNQTRVRFGVPGSSIDNDNCTEDENYHRLTKELDSIKLMIINL